MMVSNCPRCQIVQGVKLSSLHGRCQIVLFCMMVSNCPRCQIVRGVKLSSSHGRCQIVLGVKLSAVSNCPITVILLYQNNALQLWRPFGVLKHKKCPCSSQPPQPRKRHNLIIMWVFMSPLQCPQPLHFSF